MTFVRKLFHAWLALLLAGAAFVLGTPTASADTNLAGLEKSIVLLGTTWSGYIFVPPAYDNVGQGFWTAEIQTFSTCTGWFAGTNGQIVTAGHCVDPQEGRKLLLTEYLANENATDLLTDAVINWKVEGSTEGTPVERSVKAIQREAVEGAVMTSPTTLQIVDFRPTLQGDVALLSASGLPKETPPLTVAGTTPTVGSELTSIGYSGVVLDWADQSQIPQASFKSGTVSAQQRSNEGVPVLEVSTDLSGGMSGGPTVNSKGEVVGVNSFGLINPSTGVEQPGENFITDTKDLRVFLDSHDVNTATTSSGGGSSSALPLIIGAVVTVLAAGLAAAAIIVRHNRRSKVATFAPAGQPAPVWPAPLPTTAPRPSNITMPEPRELTPPFAPPRSLLEHSPVPSVPGGTRIEAPHFCANCGTEHHPDEKFCPNCGRHVG